jgi:hypothetical protein
VAGTRKGARGKDRITVSLSPESAKFQKKFRAQVQSPSMSALFETMVADLKGKAEMEQLDAKFKAYYDTLPEQAMTEESAWGALGESALPSDKRYVKVRKSKTAVAER